MPEVRRPHRYRTHRAVRGTAGPVDIVRNHKSNSKRRAAPATPTADGARRTGDADGGDRGRAATRDGTPASGALLCFEISEHTRYVCMYVCMYVCI